MIAGLPKIVSKTPLGSLPRGVFSLGGKTVNEIHGIRTLAKSLLLLISLLFCFATPAYALDITLQWDANTEPDLAGYRV
jgi:hypothetical protein